MRRDAFLRTPILADHLSRIQNVQVAEVPLAGDPGGLPYPQTLEISLEAVPGATEVEIALPWEGWLKFLPDSAAGRPTAVPDVLRSRVSSWPLEGDLLLRVGFADYWSSGLDEPFKTHLPRITPIPNVVRFSKVLLTEAFLFDTLGAVAPKYRFHLDGALVAANDPAWLEKLIIALLDGKAVVPFRQHADDPTKDATMQTMPVVPLVPAGVRTLRITMASESEQLLSATWFTQNPALDAISGENLVPPALANFEAQQHNPAHPNFSVIPARAVFAFAPDAAYAPGHGMANPIRAALSAALPVGATYRDLSVVRPPIVGEAVGSDGRRPYPMYQLCWRGAVAANRGSIRLPLSGRLYLPLVDDTYTFWVIPRSADPLVVAAGDHIRLSLAAPAPARYIGVPATTVSVPMAGVNTVEIYAHARDYDGRMAWEGYKRVQPRRNRLQQDAKRDWGMPGVDCPPGQNVCRWFIPITAAREPYKALYGYIRESAGRHGLAPEFLQVIFFGEGTLDALTPVFDPSQAINAFGFAGLDLILYRTNRLGALVPTVPAAATAAGDADEIAEYSFDLVANGYLDAATAANVVATGATNVNEIGRTIFDATITGWGTAIELMAAELHARLDEMIAYLVAQVPPVAVTEENQRRYLAYIRFNSRPATAKGHADHLLNRVKKWTAAIPADNMNANFNAVQRLAIAQWHDRAGAYRSSE
jgi:hypothetical protein